MTTTLLYDVLQAAGIQDPRTAALEDLMSVGLAAWAAHPGEDAGGERRAYVRAALRFQMSWIMVEQRDSAALARGITWLLAETERRIAKARPAPDAEGQERHDAQTQRTLGVTPSPNAAQAAPGRNHARNDNQSSGEAAGSPKQAPATAPGSEAAIYLSAPNSETPPAPTQSRDALRAAAALAVHTKLYRLDTVLIDGKPIRRCTVAEVRDWAGRRAADARNAGRDARFALAIVANLPGNAVIGEWWRDDAEVDALYDRAEAEHAA